MRKLSALALSLVVISLAGVGSAQAHTVANAGNVYDTGNQCVYNWTSQTHTYNTVIVRSLTNTPPWHFPTANCTYRNAKPSGYLAGKWESWKWDANAWAWGICGTQGWVFGGGYELHVGRSTVGCGAGYYFVHGGAYVNNGGWVGGWLLTDYDWLTW